MSRKNLLLVCVVLISLILAACQDDAEPKTVKVAVSLPLGLGVGQEILDVIQLALDQAGGKAGDVNVELLVFSTSDPDGSPISPELERQVAAQAIKDPDVVAYLGPLTTDQSKEALPLLNEAGIVQISPSATWPGLTKPGYNPGEPGIYYPTGQRNFFRMVPSDETQGAAAARWASQLGFQTVYIVHETTAYGSGVAGIFDLTARDLDIELIASESYDPDAATAQELAALATRVVEAQPDLMYYGAAAPPRGSEFLGLVRGLDPDLQVMGPDALAQEQLITEAGADLVNGVYATNTGIPAEQAELAAGLVADYRAAFDRSLPIYAMEAYEGMNVLLHAIAHAQKATREGVLEAVIDLGEYSGIMGAWHFDERGDISKINISGMQIQDGAWTFVQVIK